MTTTTLRHNGFLASSGVNSVGGGNMGDNSDSTWIQHIGASQTYTESVIQDYTLAGDERALSIQLFWRADSGFGGVASHLFPNGAGGGAYDNWNDIQSGLATRYGQVRDSNPSGGEWSQSDINNLAVWLVDDGGAGTKPRVTELGAILETRHQPTVTASGPTGANPGTTRRPTATWSTDAKDGESQQYFQVCVYNAAQYTAGGFTPFSSTAVWDSGVANSSSASVGVGIDLPDDSYRMYVRVAKLFRGAAWWSSSSYTSFTISDTPALPTAITPADGSTVQTDLVSLSGTYNTSPLSTAGHIQFQFASDAGFTTNVKTADTVGNFVFGTLGVQLTNANRLDQRLWYLRARAVDSTGKTSGWTTAQSLTVSHPAAPGNLSPTGDRTLTFTGTHILDWDFTDPAPEGDSQTAYQVILERVDTGAGVIDTGKVSSTTTQYSATISSGLKDIPLRWKVRLYDTDDKTAGYSPYSLFRVSDAPAVTINEPDENDQVSTPMPYIDWTTTLTGGRTQAFYKVIITEIGTGTEVLNTGYIAGAAQNYTPSSTTMRNGAGYSVQVWAKDNTGLETHSTISLITAKWDTPATVFFTVSDYFAGHGYMTLFWVCTPDPNFVKFNIYRREAVDDGYLGNNPLVDTGGWELLGSVTTPNGGSGTAYSYNDYLLGSDQEVQYAVTQVATRFGVEVESFKPYENRVFNGNFEYDLGGWAEWFGFARVSGNPDLTIISSGAPEGAKFLQFDSSTAAQRLANDDPSDTTAFPMVANEQMFIRCRWQEIVDGSTLSFSLLSSGGPSANIVTVTDSNSGVGTWQTLSAAAQVPVGDYVRGGISIAPTWTGPLTHSKIGLDQIEAFSVQPAYSGNSEDYWLIDPVTEIALRLYVVTADSYTDEYEEETMHLIGRGRHVEMGDRLGYSGSLSGQYWDFPGDSSHEIPAQTAREQRLRLEALKADRNVLYLRNPFGDIFQVTAGNIQIDRTPGVGQREYATYTIPYQEVV